MPDKSAAVAELIRRGSLSPDKAREMGYGEIADQAERGMIGQRVQAPDKIAERTAYTADYKRLADAREAYGRSIPLRAQLDRFDSLNEEAGTGVGYAIPVLGNIAEALNPKVQQMSGITAELTGLARPKGSGATSDFEQRLYGRGVPSKDKFGSVNQSVTAHMRATLDEEGDRLSFQEQYLNRNGTLAGSAEAWGRYVEANPYEVPSKTAKGDSITALNKKRQDWQTYFGLKPQAAVPAPAKTPPPKKMRRYNPVTGRLE